MARLNIDETYFASTLNRELQASLGWNENEVLGFLAHLWHDSQLNLNYSGTKQDILTWSRVKFARPKQSEEAFRALVAFQLIERIGEDLYYICGNHDQIEGLKRNTKLGKKSHSPLDERKSSPRSDENPEPLEKDEEKQDDDRGEDGNSESSLSMQGKSSLYKANLYNSEQGKSSQGKSINKQNKKYKKGSDKSSPASSKKNGVPAIWKARITPDDKQLAKQWFDRANELTPKSKYSLEKFEEALCRIRFDYKFTSDHLVQIFEFIKEDDFWKHNVVSPTSLLKPSKSEPEITKLMQVVRSLKNKPKTEEELLEESFARRRAKEQQEANYFDEPIDVMGYSHD